MTKEGRMGRRRRRRNHSFFPVFHFFEPRHKRRFFPGVKIPAVALVKTLGGVRPVKAEEKEEEEEEGT